MYGSIQIDVAIGMKYVSLNSGIDIKYFALARED
jgi:hypothetical protein|tara:strand:+ start:393 stop:494 length:102 start_codon:yes stop_codon:yes gene_type:complete